MALPKRLQAYNLKRAIQVLGAQKLMALMG
jgi:hypothetical protein